MIDEPTELKAMDDTDLPVSASKSTIPGRRAPAKNKHQEWLKAICQSHYMIGCGMMLALIAFAFVVGLGKKTQERQFGMEVFNTLQLFDAVQVEFTVDGPLVRSGVTQNYSALVFPQKDFFAMDVYLSYTSEGLAYGLTLSDSRGFYSISNDTTGGLMSQHCLNEPRRCGVCVQSLS